MLERDGRAVGFNDMGAHVVDMAQKGIVAERHLRYQLVNSATPNVETSHFIDLARDLSAINRRLYEQGRYYKVARVTVTSRNTYGGLGQRVRCAEYVGGRRGMEEGTDVLAPSAEGGCRGRGTSSPRRGQTSRCI